MSLLIIYDVYDIACAIAENKKNILKFFLKMRIIIHTDFSNSVIFDKFLKILPQNFLVTQRPKSSLASCCSIFNNLKKTIQMTICFK